MLFELFHFMFNYSFYCPPREFNWYHNSAEKNCISVKTCNQCNANRQVTTGLHPALLGDMLTLWINRSPGRREQENKRTSEKNCSSPRHPFTCLSFFMFFFPWNFTVGEIVFTLRILHSNSYDFFFRWELWIIKYMVMDNSVLFLVFFVVCFFFFCYIYIWILEFCGTISYRPGFPPKLPSHDMYQLLVRLDARLGEKESGTRVQMLLAACLQSPVN